MPLQSQGAVLPRLWLGTWSMGGEGFGFCDARDAQALLDSAFEAGIRHFDTAGFYAHGKIGKTACKFSQASSRINIYFQ